MTVTLQNAVKPLRKLRKVFKNFPIDPRPEMVHTLRTHTRRVEATLEALGLGHSNRSHRLLKSIVPVRKAAGKVRDIDVHIENVMKLRNQHRGEGLVRLVETLADLRAKHVRRLQEEVAHRSSKVRRRLKDCTKGIQRRFDPATRGPKTDTARLQIVTTALENWPRLSSKNLHPFRIRVKELQYMLQLAPGMQKSSLAALVKVKDTAGEWHDWLELQQIAQDVLNPRLDHRVLTSIETTVRDKLRIALSEANLLKQRGFKRLLSAAHERQGLCSRSRHPADGRGASH